jgi:hypothetical protein
LDGLDEEGGQTDMKEITVRIILGLIGSLMGLSAFFARDWLDSQGPWTMAAIIAAWAGVTFIIATRFPSRT